MSKFVTVLAIFVAFSAQGVENPPKEVSEISAKFNETMMSCPDRIWSDYSWKGLKMVLVYPSAAQSWVWDSNSNSISSIPNSELSQSTLGSDYAFFELNGHYAQSLNLEKGNSKFFELGVHEFFHDQGQKGWTSDHGSNGRGTVYPLQGEPRFYRRMIFDNLKSYLSAGSDESLGKAKYWYDKWVIEYPNEVASTTDGYEGTAEYVETMAAAISNLSCSAKDAQIKANVIAKVNSEFGFAFSGKHLGLDSEGYALGGLGALILRFNGSDLSIWNQKMKEGKTPLQVLFEGVNPISESLDRNLMAVFTSKASAVNAERGSILDDDIQNWTKKNYVRVAAPYQWVQSNITPIFFAHSSEIGKDLFPFSQDHHFLSSAKGGSDYRFKKEAVSITHYPSPCSDVTNFVLINSNELATKNNVANIKNEVIEGRLVGEIKKDDNGFLYFCVE